MTRSRVSIKDVARAAGVSTQTISRVLNERPDVAPATREKVKQAIVDLGYQPSSIARSLVRRRTQCLGVVVAGLEFGGLSRMLAGIVQQADALGYTVLLRELPDLCPDDVAPTLAKLLEREVDGIIWGVPEVGRNREWIPAAGIWRSDTPLVFLTAEPIPDLCVVQVDNYAGGRLATAHLVEGGCRHIGHISGPQSWWEARERQRGWRDVLGEAGLGAAENQCVAGDWSCASGASAFAQLAGQFPDMQAVFVANDEMALGAMYAARQIGIRIPDDLAIVGCDAIAEGAYYDPPLTTVRNDTRGVGSAAVRHLHLMIEAGGAERQALESVSISLQPDLIIRQSSVVSPIARSSLR